MTEQGRALVMGEEKRRKNRPVCQRPGTFHMLTRLVRGTSAADAFTKSLLSKHLLFEFLNIEEAVKGRVKCSCYCLLCESYSPEPTFTRKEFSLLRWNDSVLYTTDPSPKT